MPYIMKSGAGGNWKRFDEEFDNTIVKQTSGISCVSAVGEMLLQERGIAVSQEEIPDIIGEPATFESLAKALNQFNDLMGKEKWHGIFTDEEGFKILLNRNFLAVILREPFSMGHAVFIEGKTKEGFIKIKDPFDQTSYKMVASDLLRHWGGEVIFYGKAE